jgi:hypothetical protein
MMSNGSAALFVVKDACAGLVRLRQYTNAGWGPHILQFPIFKCRQGAA